jgi:hypothetical protein
VAHAATRRPTDLVQASPRFPGTPRQARGQEHEQSSAADRRWRPCSTAALARQPALRRKVGRKIVIVIAGVNRQSIYGRTLTERQTRGGEGNGRARHQAETLTCQLGSPGESPDFTMSKANKSMRVRRSSTQWYALGGACMLAVAGRPGTAAIGLPVHLASNGKSSTRTSTQLTPNRQLSMRHSGVANLRWRSNNATDPVHPLDGISRISPHR